jgi:O-antigen ligase
MADAAARQGRLARLDGWARIVILALTLVLCCAFGLLTPYLLAVVGIVLFFKGALAQQLPAAYGEPTSLLFVAGVGVLLACYAVTMREATDALLAFNFIMLILYGPIRLEFSKAAAPGNARRVANLASLGVLVALAVTLFQLYVIGAPRADNILFGAILLANTAIVLGFIALIGTMTDGPYRWGYLLMPVIGLVVAGLTGSRGPLLAVVPLMVIAAIFMARHFRISAWIAGLSAAGLVAAGGGIIWAMQSRALTIFSAIGEVLAGRDVSSLVDETTRYRFDLYVAGYHAFLQSPIVGHGWARLMSAAWPFLPADKAPYVSLPQLHNDVVNFAVAAGVIGVGVYLLFLAAPLAGILRSPRDSQFNVRLYGGLVLVTAYIFDGLTDLMLGFEFHTAIYACLAAILIGYCRDERPA